MMEESERVMNGTTAQGCTNYGMGRFFQRSGAFDCMHGHGTGSVGVGVGGHAGFPYTPYHAGDWGLMHGAYSSGLHFNRGLNSTSSNYFPVSSSRDYNTSNGSNGLPSAFSVTGQHGHNTLGHIDNTTENNYGNSICGTPPSPCSSSSDGNPSMTDLDKKENKIKGMIPTSSRYIFWLIILFCILTILFDKYQFVKYSLVPQFLALIDVFITIWTNVSDV